MFGNRFQLNDKSFSIVQEIGSHMPGGFFIYKEEEPGELLYANGAVLRIFGCADLEEFKELTGFTFRGMIHPDDYEAVFASISQQIRHSSEKMDYAEYRIIRKDGAVRWVDDYGHYSESDTYGGIYYVFISDITEKKEKIQKELSVRDSMFVALSSDYRSVYYVDLDEDEAVCYLQDRDFSDAPALGTRLPFLSTLTDYGNRHVAESYRTGFLQFIQPDNIRAELLKQPVIAYRYLSTTDGREVYTMLRMAGVRHVEDRADHRVHAIGMGFTDIDAEMRETMKQQQALAEALTAAEQASQAKSAFLSAMSHEIRTPMNAIIGLDRLALRNRNLPGETRDYLEKIGESANHLLDLINDVLEMSRIGSGRMTVRNAEFCFTDMLGQVNTLISGQCRDKGVAYEYRTQGKIDDYYVGDEAKLRQVLLNILGNAVKFTPEGGTVSFLIEEGKRYGGKAALKMTFRDTGIGMSEEYLPHIFDAFSQEDSTSTSKYGSTGLGMPITRSIVEMMNGRIEVESRKGAGTTFTVTLALGETDRQADGATEDGGHAEKPGARTTDAPDVPRAELKDRRILLAEDVEVNAEIMIMVLGMRDIQADLAENGRIAVDKYLEHEPGYYDAILMDMRMPEMDGLAATRAIRSSGRKDSETIPIIALTANALDEDVQRSMQAGLNAHLSKPVEPETLFDTLETLIGYRDNIERKQEKTAMNEHASMSGIPDLTAGNRKRLVLIVEDEFVNRELLNAYLEKEYEVIFAETGAEALASIRKHIDMLSLVLLDLNLPDMNGLEILRTIKQDMDMTRIPVIVLTSDKESEVDSLNTGANDFISKPYPRYEIILARVRRCIELSENKDLVRWTERDNLTGLYNREYFYRYAEQYDLYHRQEETDALVVDVSHFHLINERYGKAYADDVLRRIGAELLSCVKEAGGIVCRREADTFQVYCPHLEDYTVLAERVTAAATGESKGRVRVRVGVYSRVDKGLEMERRFDHAKHAADTIRNSFTTSVAVYDDALHDKEVFAERLLDDFREALEQKQFLVFFQPKFDIRPETPVICGAEALVRWKHPELGMVSPGVFVPIFESNGLVRELDNYVWREAAAQVRRWKETMGRSVPVSVNVSRIDMLDPELTDTLRRLLEENRLEPGDIHLEITESAYTEDAQQIVRVVSGLREIGFQIEMDDFGSGYSSLNMLSTLPLDALKLDMLFIRTAFSENGNTRMIEITLDISRSLKVPMIAEGVETEEQMLALKKMGCDIVQGYYFSKPVPPEEFESFLK